jgi:hypothetical protein
MFADFDLAVGVHCFCAIVLHKIEKICLMTTLLPSPHLMKRQGQTRCIPNTTRFCVFFRLIAAKKPKIEQGDSRGIGGASSD